MNSNAYVRFSPRMILVNGDWTVLHHSAAQEEILRKLSSVVAEVPLAVMRTDDFRATLDYFKSHADLDDHLAMHLETGKATLVGEAPNGESLTQKILLVGFEMPASVDFMFSWRDVPPDLFDWDNEWTEIRITNIPIPGIRKTLSTPVLVLTFPGGFTAISVGRRVEDRFNPEVAPTC